MRRLGVAPLVLVAVALTVSFETWAQAPPALSAPSATASASAAVAKAPPPPPVAVPASPARDVELLRQKTERVRALLAGRLEPGIRPEQLFEVPLSNAAAVRVEVLRLRAVIEAEARDAADGGPPSKVAAPDAGAALGPEARALLDAQLDLDRARLAFLSLAGADRKRLLDEHSARVSNVAAAIATGDAVAAESKAARAAEDRKKALEDVKRARSEAVRLLAEERARLLGVKEALARYEAQLIRDEAGTVKQAEKALEWRRRVGDHIRKQVEGTATASDADAAYPQLVKTLRASRTELDAILTDITHRTSRVPPVGTDRLDTAGVDVDRSSVDSLRAELSAQAERLRSAESNAQWQRAEALLDQTESLNRDRLRLYPYLSEKRRDALTSFSTAGVDQARNEARQVSLVARHHALAAVRWIAGLEDPHRDRTSEVVAGLSVLKLLVVVVLFFWWRRRAGLALTELQRRAEEAAREPRASPVPRAAERVLAILSRVRSQAEWIMFLWLILEIAGPAFSELREVRLVWIIVTWTIGGAAVVNAVDAIAETSGAIRSTKVTATLRLRSLRLIGRVTVALGLTLALTTELVAQGTIYNWVLQTCWFVVIPIILILVRWWQPVIFESIAAERRKGPVTEWVHAHRSGWTSFAAAVLGGGYLLGSGTARAVRGYVSTFNTTRRVLAYLFRREVAKQAAEREKARDLTELPPEATESLDPECLPGKPMPVQDREIQEIIGCIDRTGGGVFAIVGERGSGKSTLLHQIRDLRAQSLVVDVPAGGAKAFHAALCSVLNLSADAPTSKIREVLDAHDADNAVLLDNAHRLVRPTIGGLDDFDSVVALARESSSKFTWVFAVGSVVWQYIERARGARPMFDEVIVMRPWSEEAIAELLTRRTSVAHLEATFDALMTEEVEEDETLRFEQRMRTEANYYRLLWDYARGNPAVAVYFWRDSLSLDSNGHAVVQLFRAPDTADLEGLPDHAAFVLRAVLQLEYAAVEDMVEATMLPERQVRDALRYAVFRGYVEISDSRYRIAWKWFRAVATFLQRRHLVAGVRS